MISRTMCLQCLYEKNVHENRYIAQSNTHSFPRVGLKSIMHRRFRRRRPAGRLETTALGSFASRTRGVPLSRAARAADAPAARGEMLSAAVAAAVTNHYDLAARTDGKAKRTNERVS